MHSSEPRSLTDLLGTLDVQRFLVALWTYFVFAEQQVPAFFEHPAYANLNWHLRRKRIRTILACSPKADPDVMRVLSARMGKETLDVDEAKEAA